MLQFIYIEVLMATIVTVYTYVIDRQVHFFLVNNKKKQKNSFPRGRSKKGML